MKRFVMKDSVACYHCMTRTAGGALLFGQREKEVLRKMIWQVADFCGVEVLTYAVMGNHFHVLVRVFPQNKLPDDELIRRCGVLYPKPSKYDDLSASAVQRTLAQGEEDAAALRRKLLARMGDVSAFMKTLKQRFSVWYNHTHDRFGTLWAERFKSVLVEGRGNALQTMAAYIDLNPVRARLTDDPKDYRFCGYGEAVAGRPEARRGIAVIWADRVACSGAELSSFSLQADALKAHRSLLFAKGEHEQIISREQAIKVLEKQDAALPRGTVLRCRVRYFTDGAILGSKDFVQSFAKTWESERGRQRPPRPNALAGAHWGDLTTLRGIRKRVFS